MHWYILMLVIGLIAGYILRILIAKKPKSAGYLVIVDSNEPGENPYLFLDPDITPYEMKKEKYVTFKISLK